MNVFAVQLLGKSSPHSRCSAIERKFLWAKSDQQRLVLFFLPSSPFQSSLWSRIGVPKFTRQFCKGYMLISMRISMRISTCFKHLQPRDFQPPSRRNQIASPAGPNDDGTLGLPGTDYFRRGILGNMVDWDGMEPWSWGFAIN